MIHDDDHDDSGEDYDIDNGHYESNDNDDAGFATRWVLQSPADINLYRRIILIYSSMLNIMLR